MENCKGKRGGGERGLAKKGPRVIGGRGELTPRVNIEYEGEGNSTISDIKPKIPIFM